MQGMPTPSRIFYAGKVESSFIVRLPAGKRLMINIPGCLARHLPRTHSGQSTEFDRIDAGAAGRDHRRQNYMANVAPRDGTVFEHHWAKGWW